MGDLLVTTWVGLLLFLMLTAICLVGLQKKREAQLTENERLIRNARWMTAEDYRKLALAFALQKIEELERENSKLRRSLFVREYKLKNESLDDGELIEWQKQAKRILGE